MATLSAASSAFTRCGYDAGQSFRGVYIIPLRSSPPRRSFRVVAEASRASQGRRIKKINAVDATAASLNSAADEAEGGRVLDKTVFRSGEEEPEVAENEKAPQLPLAQLLMEKLKLDKAVDEVVGFMAPREKGDIRDVILMSFSFAILVYISQRLVSLYCVLRHMAAHPF